MAKPIADVLHQLADAVAGRPEDWRRALIDVLARNGMGDAVVEQRGRSLVIRWADGGGHRIDLVYPDVVPGGPLPENEPDVVPTVEEIARAVNEGALTDELNDAVGWDADLVV